MTEEQTQSPEARAMHYPEETRTAVAHAILYNLYFRICAVGDVKVATFALTSLELAMLRAALRDDVSELQGEMFPDAPADQPEAKS